MVQFIDYVKTNLFFNELEFKVKNILFKFLFYIIFYQGSRRYS